VVDVGKTFVSIGVSTFQTVLSTMGNWAAAVWAKIGELANWFQDTITAAANFGKEVFLSVASFARKWLNLLDTYGRTFMLMAYKVVAPMLKHLQAMWGFWKKDMVPEFNSTLTKSVREVEGQIDHKVLVYIVQGELIRHAAENDKEDTATLTCQIGLINKAEEHFEDRGKNVARKKLLKKVTSWMVDSKGPLCENQAAEVCPDNRKQQQCKSRFMNKVQEDITYRSMSDEKLEAKRDDELRKAKDRRDMLVSSDIFEEIWQKPAVKEEL